jgi:hypothetical protein
MRWGSRWCCKEATYEENLYLRASVLGSTALERAGARPGLSGRPGGFGHVGSGGCPLPDLRGVAGGQGLAGR